MNGAGTASFAITFDDALLGALAGGEGSATISFTGALTPYAIGSMSGSTVDTSVLTVPLIVDAVWDALAASYTDTGTMGAKLNSASASGDPWGAIIESGMSAGELLKLIAAVVQGDASGLENGSPVFKSIDGTIDRVIATYSSGTRTVTNRDAS